MGRAKSGDSENLGKVECVVAQGVSLRKVFFKANELSGRRQIKNSLIVSFARGWLAAAKLRGMWHRSDEKVGFR